MDEIISPVDYYEEIKKERLDIIKTILKGFTQDNIKKPLKPLSKKKKISKKCKPKLSVADLLHQVGIKKEEYDDDVKKQIKIKDSSIYNTFKKNLLIYG